MKTVGVYEVKTHLSKLLNAVCKGQKYTITKHGVPIAIISPIGALSSDDVQETVSALKAFKKRKKPFDMSIRDMIEEGRRF